MTEKQRIRTQGKKARRAMRPEERSEASVRIARRIGDSVEFRCAETILIYNAVPDEVDLGFLTGLPEAEGKKFCYPHVLGEGKMEILQPSGPGDWKEGQYGIMEPDEKTSLKVNAEELDLVLCPCTAFDEQGGRMGMGGGYYDRYLPNCVNAVIAAAAFEAQKVSAVPSEETDVPMDMVFTESAVYRRRKPDADRK